MQKSENPTKKRKWLYRKVPLNGHVFLLTLLLTLMLIPVSILYGIELVYSYPNASENFLLTLNEYVFYPFYSLFDYLTLKFESIASVYIPLLFIYAFFLALIVERLISFLVFFIKLAFLRKNLNE